MKYKKVTQEEFNNLSKNNMIRDKDLSQIDLANNEFDRPITIKNCRFWKSIESQGISYLQGPDFTNTNLEGIKFENCHMEGVKMTQLQKSNHTENCKFSSTNELNLSYKPPGAIARILGDYSSFIKEIGQESNITAIKETSNFTDKLQIDIQPQKAYDISKSDDKWANRTSERVKTSAPRLGG